MTTNALDPEGTLLLDLCEEFATPIPRMEQYLEIRLLDLFEHHKRYTAAVDGLVAPLITMGHWCPGRKFTARTYEVQSFLGIDTN
jgi:hypothetical protein